MVTPKQMEKINSFNATNSANSRLDIGEYFSHIGCVSKRMFSSIDFNIKLAKEQNFIKTRKKNWHRNVQKIVRNKMLNGNGKIIAKNMPVKKIRIRTYVWIHANTRRKEKHANFFMYC